jgi:hypothetical protein
VTLSGVGVETRLAIDGQLALKAYHAVPFDQWLDRMTIIQPWLYNAAFFRLLSGAYVLSLIALLALLWRAARRAMYRAAAISSGVSRVIVAPDMSSAGT